MPTWAPESWVDSDRSARCTPAPWRRPLGSLVDLSAVDGDEREFGGDEHSASQDQQERSASSRRAVVMVGAAYPAGHTG